MNQQAALSSEGLGSLMKPATERAKSAFTKEYEDLFPRIWTGNERTRRLLQVLRALSDVQSAEIYLALLDEPKRVRFVWMLEVLRLSPEDFPEIEGDDSDIEELDPNYCLYMCINYIAVPLQ